MDSRDEVPAPVLRFFIGLSSSEFSALPVAGTDGRQMVIFLGARLVFDGGLEVRTDCFGESDTSESLP